MLIEFAVDSVTHELGKFAVRSQLTPFCLRATRFKATPEYGQLGGSGSDASNAIASSRAAYRSATLLMGNWNRVSYSGSYWLRAELAELKWLFIYVF